MTNNTSLSANSTNFAAIIETLRVHAETLGEPLEIASELRNGTLYVTYSVLGYDSNGKLSAESFGMQFWTEDFWKNLNNITLAYCYYSKYEGDSHIYIGYSAYIAEPQPVKVNVYFDE